jgi:CheY-like chemotaxis protein
MDDQRIEVLYPRAEEFEEAEQAKQGERFSDIRGRKILLVDDMRPNADVVAASLRDLLVKEYGADATVADVRSLGGDYAEPIPREMHERLARQFDAVIVALAS